MLSSSHCPSEKSPVLQSRMASPVTALHSSLHHSSHSVECDRMCAQRLDFLLRIVYQQHTPLCWIMSSPWGEGTLYSSLKAWHPAQCLACTELKKHLLDWIHICSSTSQFTSSSLIYSFRDHTCWSRLQLELNRKFISNQWRSVRVSRQGAAETWKWAQEDNI